MSRTPCAVAAIILVFGAAQGDTPAARPRAADLGLKIGILPPGPLDAITDVAGVTVFLAAIEATEEAVYNSLFKATTTTGNGHTIEALPIERTAQTLKEHRAIR
jgi:hypothetical protein